MAHITVVGLGPGNPEHLSKGAWIALEEARCLWLRTSVHPTIPSLLEKGILFQSFDDLYEKAEDFESLYVEIVGRLIAMAGEQSVTYAVPGHPLVAETTVKKLIAKAKEANITVSIVPSMSCLDALYAALQLDPVEGLAIYDALDLPSTLDTTRSNIFTQVYNQWAASQLKLALMEHYPDDQPVKVVRAAGIPKEQRIEQLPLWKLDNLKWLDHLTSVVVPPALPVSQPDYGSLTDTPSEQRTSVGRCRYPLDPLVDVMARLRSDDGCPWDREQTHESLKRYLVEEAYEVLEAIDTGKDSLIAEELGDVLLQVIFHAQLARERKAFDINEVIKVITQKLIRRHPHVFGDIDVGDSSEVVVNWEKIKAGEKKERTSILDGVPPHLPGLMEAEKIQRKAAKVGFDWDDISGVLEKVPEEIAELAVAGKDDPAAFEEFGDLLFTLVNAARHMGIDPEAALRASTRKFIRRFKMLERLAEKTGRSLEGMTLKEMDQIWDRIKAEERQG